MKTKFILIMAGVFLVIGCKRQKGVDFRYPKDGAKVKNPVQIQMVVRGMKVKPAGTMEKNTGHHHLLVDRGYFPKGQVIPPSDGKTIYHFGKGQTKASINLPKGKHKLTLQFADGAHRSYGKKWAKTITVTVQ